MSIKKPKEKHKYVFPNILAKAMKNVPMTVQLESSMAASSMILMGMILMSILLTFFTEQTMAFKIITLLNLAGAFVFISSSLVTTYQQYVSYMNVMELQKTMALESGSLNGMPNLPIDDLNMPHKINRGNQLLFFGGLLLPVVLFFLGGWIDSLLPEIIYAKYLIQLVGIFIGVTMIYFAVRKKKKIKKKIVTSIEQQQIPQVPQPQIQTSQPVQQQASTVPAPSLRFAPLPPQKIEAPRAIYVKPQPLQQPVLQPAPQLEPTQQPVAKLTSRPIPAPLLQRQLQRPAQRPVEQPQVPQRRPQEPQSPQRSPQLVNRPTRRPILHTKPKSTMGRKFGTSKNNKKIKMLNAIDKKMEERVYEINRLKSQQGGNFQ